MDTRRRISRYSGLRRLVIETHVDQIARPDVLIIQGIHLLSRRKLNDVADDRAGREDDLRRLGVPRFDGSFRIGFKHRGVLMKIRRKKKKRGVLHDELAGVLDDPALAEEEHLPPGPSRIADDGPFLECDLE